MTTAPTYLIFDPSKLTIQEPQPGPKDQPGVFYINLRYNYGTDAAPSYGPFELEFTKQTKMTTFKGIVTKVSEKFGTKTESIQISINPKFGENQQLIDCFNSIHARCAELIMGVKTKIGKRYFDAAKPEATGFKSLVYFKLDETTNEIVPDSSATMFLKLFNWSNKKTMFFNLNNEEIDRDILKDVKFTFIPKLQFRRIRAGPTITVQMELAEALVTDIPDQQLSCTLAAMDDVKADDPTVGDKVNEQLSKLMKSKETKVLSPFSESVPDVPDVLAKAIAVPKRFNIPMIDDE